MLVLTRKVNEEIIIGGDIRIKILEINGSRIRLGISAPREVPVHRSEMMDREAWEKVRDNATESAINTTPNP